jgi:hypothetical protein
LLQAEALALQKALQARGVSTFVCAVPVGQSIMDAVVSALHGCKLVVIMGTATYGKDTGCPFCTKQELNYIVNQKKPFFLVKMCDTFQEATAKFNLGGDISYYPWRPVKEAEKQVPPADLVDQIVKRLSLLQ